MSRPLASDKFAEWLQQSPWGNEKKKAKRYALLINLAGVAVIGLIVVVLALASEGATRDGRGADRDRRREWCVHARARIEVPQEKPRHCVFCARTRVHAPRKFYSMCSVSAELPLGKSVICDGDAGQTRREVEFTCQEVLVHQDLRQPDDLDCDALVSGKADAVLH